MIKTKVAFLEGWILSSQSEQSEKFSKSSDRLKKRRPSRQKTLLFWSCKQVINLRPKLTQVKLKWLWSVNVNFLRYFFCDSTRKSNQDIPTAKRKFLP